MIFPMKYNLSQTQIGQIVACSKGFEWYYSKTNYLILINITEKAIMNQYLDEEDIYELLDVLPKIIPQYTREPDHMQEDSDSNWQEYIDEQWSRYKREMNKLHQSLSSLIFLQSAVYRKNMRSVDETLDKIIIKNENGIKKLR